MYKRKAGRPSFLYAPPRRSAGRIRNARVIHTNGVPDGGHPQANLNYLEKNLHFSGKLARQKSVNHRVLPDRQHLIHIFSYFFAKTLDKSGFLCYNAYIYKFCRRRCKRWLPFGKVNKSNPKISFFKMLCCRVAGCVISCIYLARTSINKSNTKERKPS